VEATEKGGGRGEKTTNVRKGGFWFFTQGKGGGTRVILSAFVTTANGPQGSVGRARPQVAVFVKATTALAKHPKFEARNGRG